MILATQHVEIANRKQQQMRELVGNVQVAQRMAQRCCRERAQQGRHGQHDRVAFQGDDGGVVQTLLRISEPSPLKRRRAGCRQRQDQNNDGQDHVQRHQSPQSLPHRNARHNNDHRRRRDERGRNNHPIGDRRQEANDRRRNDPQTRIGTFHNRRRAGNTRQGP